MRRVSVIYLVISLGLVGVNQIYALFGHGVRSASMTFMFLYPFLGGTLLFSLIEHFLPGAREARGYRLFSNLHHSGIAALTLGSFLKGILDIAGTGSSFTIAFFAAGWIFAAAALTVFVRLPGK